MADNKTTQSATPATIPANTTVATKEVSFSGQTADVQLIEVVAVTGSEGSRTLNEISDASGLKIQDGGNTITVDGTVAVTHAALTELAAAIDTEVQVDIVSSALPSGAATSAKQDTQTTALQAIQTAVEILDNTVGGNELQVDIVSSALPSGASTLAEQQTQTTALQLIDDAVFVDDADWTDNTSKHISIGGVYQSSPHTVTDGDVSPALMDANGRLIVAATDNGGSLTVDGTVAATQSGTWNVTNVSGTVSLPTGAATSAKQDTVIGHLDGVEGLLTTIDADTGTIAGAVSGSEMQVDVVGALPAGTNNIGDVDVLTLPALPAGNNNIGDVDIATIAAGDNNIGNVDIVTMPNVTLAASTNNIGDVDILSIAAGDNNIGNVDVVTLPALAAGTNEIGSLLPPDTDVTAHTNYAKKYYTNSGAVTDGIVWSPAAGKRYHVVSMFINTSAAATVTFEDDKAGGDEAIMKMELAANSGMTINFGEQYPLASGEDAADLLVTTSAGNIYITVTGYEI